MAVHGGYLVLSSISYHLNNRHYILYKWFRYIWLTIIHTQVTHTHFTKLSFSNKLFIDDAAISVCLIGFW